MINIQLPLSRVDDWSIKVHTAFETIQGEGPFTGHFALFVRFYGCNLQCPHCDTTYTGDYFALGDPKDVAATLHDMYGFTELVVVTGGEPFRQRGLGPFVRELVNQYGLHVQVETNGMFYLDAAHDKFPWLNNNVTVVCSPKTGKINPAMAESVDAYKYVLDRNDIAEDGLPIHALGHPLGHSPHVARPPRGWNGPIYLQPMDTGDPIENALNMMAVRDSVLKHKRYIMGIQLHKYAGLP